MGEDRTRLTELDREKLYDRLLANGNITRECRNREVGALIDRMDARPVGDYRVVVVHTDDSTEVFGCFASESAAVDWAMENRISLGLHRSASWRVEEFLP